MGTSKQDKLQQECDAFNARYPVGSEVSLRRDNGQIVRTSVRAEAHILNGHTAVGWFKDIAGCYKLDRAGPPELATH